MNFDRSRLMLRPARPDDALCLGVLATQVFLDTYATAGIRPAIAHEVLAAFSTDTCAELIGRPGGGVQVAEVDHHLVGFFQLDGAATHELAPKGSQAELVRLYVQEPFTGRGIGTALLHAAEAFARTRGVEVLWLTPWVHNRRAIAFYVARGYRDHGTTPFHMDGETHENRVMARVIGAR
jgi:diamine N-acetyltransferase